MHQLLARLGRSRATRRAPHAKTAQDMGHHVLFEPARFHVHNDDVAEEQPLSRSRAHAGDRRQGSAPNNANSHSSAGNMLNTTSGRAVM